MLPAGVRDAALKEKRQRLGKGGDQSTENNHAAYHSTESLLVCAYFFCRCA
jgi:hypothetical protein